MATRFVRIDLSDNARDFRPIAIEPGVPLLDRSNSNAKVLFRWLGGLLAEPVWEGESVNFYVRDDSGGRLEEVSPQTADADDLKSLLKDDVAAVRDRLEKAKPETSTERAVKKTVLRCFQELVDNPHRTDLDDYFFRYKDVQGRWRLVWCWGYQRVDQEPAPAVVCTDSECSLLFVRRPGQSPKCPACEKAWAAKPRKKRRLKVPALLLLLLLLLAAGGWYWWTHPLRLIAEPGEWTGPAGSRIDFKVQKAGLFSKEDVSQQAVPIVLDPHVARLDSRGGAVALNPGKTLVRFHLGSLHTDATLVVGEAKMPKSLAIEPRTIELGIGTTARPRAIGTFDDGNQADLTDAVEWSAEKENVVYAYNGLLEGVSEGTSVLTARYRLGDAKPVEAGATVTVAKVDFESLAMKVQPSQVGIGRASQLHIDAVAAGGKHYSVLESSMLTTQVTPPYQAAVQGRLLKGQNVGRGKLAATFAEKHTAGAEFEVVGTGIDTLTVYPEKLAMVVGEIADLSIAAPPGEPVRLTSSKSDVVEVTAANRLVGRKEGAATITVAQGSEKRTVDVTVTRTEFSALAFDPARLVVPLDDTVQPRVMARIEGQRQAELSPDIVSIEKQPSPRYAAVETKSLKVRGVRPTDSSSPQTLAIRLGNLQASAPVEVVIAPMRLTLLPPGPIDLPLGQMMRLNGWATYSGGRRVLVPAERLDWHAADEAEGLELRGQRVAALKAGAGPLSVFASYFGRESNRVLFKSVEAGDVTLRAEVDRPVRLAGETGGVFLTASGPKGDVELVPELASFKSSESGVLAIDEKSGAFRAAAPGKATVTASHAAAKQPATLEMSVYDPKNARLVFDPAAVKVAVDEVARLPLYLEVKDGEKTERVPLVGPGVGYAMTQPQAIRWQPPWLTGLSPAKPFELTASFAPILSSTASATVEVTAAETPDAIRIAPSQATLAAGQTVVFRVEEQLPGSTDQWREVRPQSVSWTVPSGLVWAAPSGELRAAATVPADAKGEYELRANYAGKQAAAVVKVASAAPDPNAAGAKLVVVREPEGQFVPAGSQQRHQIMIERDGKLEPAANVLWPETFENEFVTWQAPVLTAKRGGYEQWLRAEVAGRTVLWRVQTYEPAAFERAIPRSDQPVAVKILSDQITGPGQAVRFPVGAEFDDFRVEAHYADGFTRLVTKKATLRTNESADKAPLTASAGRLIGVRPGKTNVSAEYDGVTSQQPLPAEVLAGLDIDQIRLTPSPLTMLRGETLALDAVGYKNGKSVGVITGLAKLTWQSSNPQVAQVSGPSVSGLGLGQASITAAMGAIQSQPAPVEVVASLAEPLTVEPKVVRLRVGESVRVGPDVAVFRGDLDVSRQVSVTPVQPDVVRFDSFTRSLVGVSPGTSAVAVALGDKLANVIVEVAGGAAPIDGTVVVEPSSSVLAPGQMLELRAYVITAGGARVDRTESAVFSSSDPARIRMMANKACAGSPGTVTVTALLPGTQQTGAAVITVNNEEIAELLVDPPRLDMSIGDVARPRFLGRAASGTHELYPQPDLTVTAGGLNPAAIRIGGPNEVTGAAEGQATLNVGWKNRLTAQAPVNVTNSPWSGLAIEPANAAVYPGQAVAYQVTAMRGGQRRVLGPESGVQLFTGNQSVAEPVGGLTISAKSPGQTTVVAEIGGARAETTLNVLAGVPAATDLVGGPRGYVIRPGRRHGRWIGGRWVERGGAIDVGPGVVGVPRAGVAKLRFVPDVVRMGANTPAQPVRVVELLADGSLGRDVSADPALELTEPPSVVKVEKTADGPTLRPIGVGQTRLGARLGTLTADPLLVEVGDRMAGTARLEVTPDPITVWSGEEGRPTAVRVIPGPGQLPFDIDYKLTVPAGQGIIASSGDKAVRGLSPGAAQVIVTAVDPSGAYNGVSTMATVQVGTSDTLAVEPAEVTLQVGQTAPPLSVMAVAPDGTRYQVPATLQSADPAVLAPDAAAPGRFVAKGLGETQLRADYRGRSAFAKVVVSGRRFLDVKTSDPVSGPDPQSFDITIEVLAAESEGPLEYRVYGAGQPPAETWVPAQAQGDTRVVTLRSPRMNYGPRGSLYHLVIEARSPGGGVPQQYPLTFRLKEGIERLDRPK